MTRKRSIAQQNEFRTKGIIKKPVYEYNNKPFYIYLITNIVTGEVYVGKRKTHITDIFHDTYYGSGNNIVKHLGNEGVQNLIKTIYKVTEDETEAFKIEKELIIKVSKHLNCLNITYNQKPVTGL